MQDDEILTLLPTIRRPTLVTRDKDFFQKRLCNERYCLAFFAVRPTEVACYVHRLFQHIQFKAWSQRKGCVIRVSSSGISV